MLCLSSQGNNFKVESRQSVKLDCTPGNDNDISMTQHSVGWLEYQTQSYWHNFDKVDVNV